MHTIGRFISDQLSFPGAAAWTKRLVDQNGCTSALDVGCGTESHLSSLRPGVRTIGVDSDEASLELSRQRNVHDQYIRTDILKQDLATLLPSEFGGKVDLVSLYGVIEHLPKGRGYELLEACERLARKLVVLETPNGFVPQGPEFGNDHMRHLSGWFAQEFQGLGYTVVGTTGTRYLRGYAAGLKYPYKGVGSLDVLLSRFLRSDKSHRHAFNLFAYKDVRGIPPRLRPTAQESERNGT